MAFSKVKTDSIADSGVTTAKIANDAVVASKVDDDGTGFTVGNLTSTSTVTLGSGGTNWTLPTARGTDKYVLQINGTTGAADWVESLTAPEITGHNYDVSGSTDDGGINAYEAPYAYTGTTNATTTISALSSTTGLKVGQYISGAGIPANTTISSINAGASTMVISNAVTVSGTQTGVALKIQKTPGEKNGGKVILTGTNFGGTIGEISVAITTSSGVVIANASYLSGLSGTNTIVAEWTGTEGSYSTDLTSSYSGKLYFKMTKSGLASNVYDSNTTLTSDATLSTPSQTGGDRSVAPSTTTLGTYGFGRIAGGGQDSNTKVLLNFDRGGGADIEESSNTAGDGYEVTAYNQASIKASPFGDGKSAMFFDGSNDKLTIPFSNDFHILNGANTGADFTVEFWMQMLSATSNWQGILDFYDYDGTAGNRTGWRIYNYDADSFYFDMVGGVGGIHYEEGFDLNTWYHLAFVRSGNTLTMYKNGVSTGDTYTTNLSGNNLNAPANTTSLSVGIGTDGTGNLNKYFNGYLDEIRIVKGTAVYTADFDVPTSRLTEITNTKLLIHSNKDEDLVLTGSGRFIEVGSTGQFQSATSSPAIATVPTGLNDGGFYANKDTNGFVRIENPLKGSGLFGITTGHFTIDFWFRRHDLKSSGSRLFSDGKTSGTGVSIFMDGNGALRLYWDSDGSGWDQFNNQTLGHTATDDTWEHYCLARKSGTHYLFYVNGMLKQVITGNNTASFPTDMGNGVILGKDGVSNAEYTAGTWKNFRISNNFRPEQSGDPCYVAGTAGTTTGGAVGNGSNFAAFNISSSSANAEFNYTGDGTSSSRGDGIDDYTKCFVPLNNGIFADSATTGTTHTITNTGSFHSQGHKGIAPALAWPTNGKTFGSSGVYFDGSTDYLELGAASPLGSGKFTIDFWLNFKTSDSTGNYVPLFGNQQTTGTGGVGYFNINLKKVGNVHNFYVYEDSTQNDSGYAVDDGQWHHCMVTRNSDSYLELWVDGTRRYISGSTATTNYDSAELWRIAHDDNQGFYYKGYLDNIRIVIGEDMTSVSTDQVYSANGTTYTLPTRAYGTFGQKTPDAGTVTLVATGAGDYTWSEVAGGTALPGTLAVGSTAHSGSGDSRTHTATVTGSFSEDTTSTIVNGTRSDVTTNNILLKAQNDADSTKAITLGSSGGYDGIGITLKSTEKPVLFGTRRYIGTQSNRDITGFGFQPDFVWIKNRAVTNNHYLVDSVRGAGKRLQSNTTAAQASVDLTQHSGFIPDGFSLGASTSNNVNKDANKYVAWAWKAGTAYTPTAAGYTSPTASINVAGGFGIYKVTDNSTASGTTISHGLGVQPDVIFGRSVDGSLNWDVYLRGVTSTSQRLVLNTDAGIATATVYPTAPSSTVFTTAGNANHGSGQQIFYVWAGVAGVSSFGTFTGGGAGNSKTITTNSAGGSGFRPRFKMIKRVSDTGSWWAQDSSTYIAGTNSQGSGNKSLFKWEHDASAFESDVHCVIEDTNTGFIIHTQTALSGLPNANADTYFYMAFA